MYVFIHSSLYQFFYLFIYYSIYLFIHLFICPAYKISQAALFFYVRRRAAAQLRKNIARDTILSFPIVSCLLNPSTWLIKILLNMLPTVMASSQKLIIQSALNMFNTVYNFLPNSIRCLCFKITTAWTAGSVVHSSTEYFSNCSQISIVRKQRGATLISHF